MAEWYKKVPRDFDENMQYRLAIMRKAARDPTFKRAMKKACEEDILFFFNAFCLAAGTLVVTQRGPVPIEEVTSRDLVWDGVNWVSQGGALHQGRKSIIFAYGVELTSDHKVWTKHGWQESGCGYDREAVRLADGYQARWQLPEHDPGRVAVPVCLRADEDDRGQQPSPRPQQQLRLRGRRRRNARQGKRFDLPHLAIDEIALLQSEQLKVSSLRRSGHQSLPALAGEFREFSGGHGRASSQYHDREDRQRWQLRTEQLPLGYVERAGQQYQSKSAYRNIYGNVHAPRSHENLGPVSTCDSLSDQKRNDRRCAAGSSHEGGKAEVYDLINCGPRRAFTVLDKDGIPLLVHNCFLYEPRDRYFPNGKKKPNIIPFITWEHQDPAILKIQENLGKCDIGVEKSRGEGMSWILVLFAVHDLLFQKMSSVGLVSKSELDVDNPQSSSSLFWKIDWELTMLPRWMVPPLGKNGQGGLVRNVSRHTLINEVNGSNITGYAATGDVASGGRARWFGMDELSKFPRPADEEAMASTQHVTDSRLIVGTPKGSAGAYYKAMHDIGSNMVKVIVDWKENPSKNRGLYTMVNNLPVAVDPLNNPLPKHYDPPTRDVMNLFATLRNKGYKLDGVLRSPWYDDECNRTNATPKSIAQELDRDYGGSQHRAFGEDFRNAAKKKIRPALLQGDFSYDPETLEGKFEENENGPLKLWVIPGANGKLPDDQYVLAGDVATGLGGSHTSNSALVGFNSKKQQILEFASNTIVPEDFADLSIALAKWLGNAYLGWEQNGPGQPYTNRVLKRGYYKVYRRTVHDKFGKKKQQKVGWWTDDKTKGIMFGEFSRGVKAGQIIVYSEDLLKETGEYTWENGIIVHSLSKTTDDGSSQGKAHGDRVIAASVGAMMLSELKQEPLKGDGSSKAEDLDSLGKRTDIPVDTLAHRMRERQEAREDAEGNGWDSRTNYDLAMGSAGR